MVEFDVHEKLILLTGCDFVSIHNGKNIQKACGHQEFGAVIGVMAGLIGDGIAEERGQEAQQTGSAITNEAAILNQLGKYIAASGNLRGGGKSSGSVYLKS